MHRIVLGVAAAAAMAFGMVSGASAAETKRVLTLDMAKGIADACEARAVEAGWRPINIAIYDEGGNLMLFRRQDGSFLGSIQIAQLKGHSSAMFPFSTRVFTELSHGKDGQPAPVPGIAHVPGIASFPGGVPIMTADGQQVGGVGVSGASSDEDEECAQAGIDAIADMLK